METASRIETGECAQPGFSLREFNHKEHKGHKVKDSGSEGGPQRTQMVRKIIHHKVLIRLRSSTEYEIAAPCTLPRFAMPAKAGIQGTEGDGYRLSPV